MLDPELCREERFFLVRQFVGHGIGTKLHEEPEIPNFVGSSEEVILKKGMVLAIEPIGNEGKASVVLGSDGYTYRTKDGSRSAHFEHTILVTKGEPIVLTRRASEK